MQPFHLIVTPDRHVWVSDGVTNKFLQYSPEGRLLSSWGTYGSLPGTFWGVHQFSVDSAGNLYVAEAFGGRAQKFTPRRGVDPALLIPRMQPPSYQRAAAISLLMMTTGSEPAPPPFSPRPTPADSSTRRSIVSRSRPTARSRGRTSAAGTARCASHARSRTSSLRSIARERSSARLSSAPGRRRSPRGSSACSAKTTTSRPSRADSRGGSCAASSRATSWRDGSAKTCRHHTGATSACSWPTCRTTASHLYHNGSMASWIPSGAGFALAFNYRKQPRAVRRAHRRRRDEPRRLLRGAQLCRHPQTAARRRRREQLLRVLDAEPAPDAGRERGRSRAGLQHPGRDRVRQRHLRGAPAGGAGDRSGAARRGTIDRRVQDVPAARPRRARRHGIRAEDLREFWERRDPMFMLRDYMLSAGGWSRSDVDDD